LIEEDKLTCARYEFSIRTPGTPPRWAEFEAELSLIWGQLTDACRAPKRDMDAIARYILHLSFYWYNFMPLSRGTAAVGYTVLVGTLFVPTTPCFLSGCVRMMMKDDKAESE
jgi:hypothetical protein